MVIHRPGIASEVPWARAEAGPGGSLSVEFAVPAMPSGRYTFLLHTANTLVNAETQFTVTGGLAATPRPTVPPLPPPTPSVDPALAGYSPLLVEAMSNYQGSSDFVSGRLTSEEKKILEWADTRLFSNPSFMASKYSPSNWPSDVRIESAQAIPLLMNEIDVQKKSNGKHVINWGVDSLDRVLDDLGIYEGMCTSCYGKADYNTVDEVSTTYHAIVYNEKHEHREMLKTFAYFAKADGEGILIRDFMENDADDFEMLYRRDSSSHIHNGKRYNRSITPTSFGWGNLSFMSQVELADETVKSFPTMVYEIVGGAKSEREAAEQWFSHINKNLIHFRGYEDDFANLFRPYSQTPYTPEPGYILIVGEAGSPSSTGLTTSAMRLGGIKSYHLLSPEKGRRTGAIEIDGEWSYHNGNMPLTRNIVDPCLFFKPWMRLRLVTMI